MGYNSVVVLSATNKTERVVIVAISQYSRLKCTSHLPINAVEVICLDHQYFLSIICMLLIGNFNVISIVLWNKVFCRFSWYPNYPNNRLGSWDKISVRVMG